MPTLLCLSHQDKPRPCQAPANNEPHRRVTTETPWAGSHGGSPMRVEYPLHVDVVCLLPRPVLSSNTTRSI